MNSPKIIAMVADSPSSDLLGAGIIKEIKKLNPNILFLGIGGPKMCAAGFNSIFDIKNLSVMGFDDVLLKYLTLKTTGEKLIKHLVKINPDVFIGLDAYSFNIKIHKALKQYGVKTVQYACPKIWAWRPKRAKKIKQFIDVVLTLFPFEKDFCDTHNINASFVGHPFADEIPIEPIDNFELKNKYKINPKDKVIAVLPGSRPSDLKYMAPLFVETIKEIHKVNSDIKFIIPLPTETLKNKLISSLSFNPCQYNIKITANNSREILSLADLVLVKSGTATLETMLLKKPMVVAYKCGQISYAIIKNLIKVKFISLPNILANEKIVAELIQDKATPDAIKNCIIKLINNPIDMEKFNQLHLKLKTNASAKVAKIVCSMLV